MIPKDRFTKETQPLSMPVATGVFLTVLLLTAASAKGENCKTVRGHLLNRPVTINCDSPTFCAEGELLGRLNGRFTQRGTAFAPAGVALGDPHVAPSIFVGSADILLNTKFCGGVLHLKDTFLINLAPSDPANPAELFFSAVHTVDGGMSTEGCFGASGQLRVSGVSTPTGVDADYEGVICGGNLAAARDE